MQKTQREMVAGSVGLTRAGDRPGATKARFLGAPQGQVKKPHDVALRIA